VSDLVFASLGFHFNLELVVLCRQLSLLPIKPFGGPVLSDQVSQELSWIFWNVPVFLSDYSELLLDASLVLCLLLGESCLVIVFKF
jgi:hypothetical protein